MSKTLIDSVPSTTLGYPISVTSKIVFYFLLPTILLQAIYLTLIASDLAVVYQHFIEDNPRWATSTLLLMWWPAVGSFMFTISTVSAWPSEQPLAKENLRFLGIQLWYFLGFPFAVVYRYNYRIFWAVEAIFANLKGQDERLEGAMALLTEPSPLELYFFLQAFLHCAPQILLQFYILLRAESSKTETASLQLLSISTSLLRMAVTTTMYQRFERRKVLGARYPWMEPDDTVSSQYTSTPQLHINKAPTEAISNFVGLPLNLPSVVRSEINNSQIHHSDDDSGEDDVFIHSEPPRNTFSMLDANPMNYNSYRDNLQQNIPEKPHYSKGGSVESEFDNDIVLEHRSENENASISDNSSKRRTMRVSIREDPEIEWRRREQADSRTFNIVDMSKHTTPPETPAPRPLSMSAIRSKIMSNAESIIDKIPRRTYKDTHDFDVPVRVRRTAVKGIEQEDGVSKLIAFIAWLLFLAARMLALSVFSYFYIDACFYFSISHYLVILFLLIWNSWSESFNRKVFYFFLSYIYIFCIMEFKMKYRKVRLWYGLYFIAVTLENFVLTGVWYWSGLWEGWWYNFMGLAIVFCIIFSYMCFLIYFLILKPKPLTVYPVMSSQSLSPAII